MATEADLVPGAIFIAPSGRPCRWEPPAGYVGLRASYAFTYLDRPLASQRRESFCMSVANLRLLHATTGPVAR